MIKFIANVFFVKVKEGKKSLLPANCAASGSAREG